MRNRWVQAALGVVLGIALLKFGNPVILDHLIESPKDSVELLFFAWPVRWGQLAMLVSTIAAAVTLGVGYKKLPKPPLLLAVWFLWQFPAMTSSIDPVLSNKTLLHFTTCMASFGLGLLVLGRAEHLTSLALGLLPFFLWSVWLGVEQHFGGLEATEKMIMELPDWQNRFPQEYLDRMAKRRIFATFVSPNAFAGSILLLLPVLLVSIAVSARRLAVPSRAVILGSVVLVASACLYWTGSKSGWLIAIGMAVVMVLRLIPSRGIRLAIACGVAVAGLAGFAVKFSPYFKAGATSVGARFDYWRAAGIAAVQNPVLGTGPGTFGKAYAKIRPPEAEMTHLVHNDYLEQASDSGVIGFIGFSVFWLVTLVRTGRAAWGDGRPELFGCWLGLSSWCAQMFSEFHLYIPALSWPAFLLAGWLWRQERAWTGRSTVTKLPPTQ